MEWPSKNISYGGVLHPAKATYSPETHQMLKVLLEESKISMMQRNKLNYYLRNGEPLPSLSRMRTSSTSRIPEVTIRPGSSKRRSQQTIVNSGVYEREKFRRTAPVIDREKEIEKLQNKMAYREDIKVNPSKILKKIEMKEDKEEMNRFDQIIQEIKEREQWLKEMEELGEGDKYRHIIEQQIQEKVREMNRLNIKPKMTK